VSSAPFAAGAAGSALAYVLATDELATVRGVLAALARQTRAGEVELVLIAPVALDAEAAEIPASLGAVRTLRCAEPLDLAAARAAGVRATAAPFVFVGETHGFPEPEMVERILARFAEGWDAVVPAIGNANPNGGPSWGGFLLDYGLFHAGREAGAVEEPLVYNAAYRRDALLALGDRLEAGLSAIDHDLHREFAAAGRRALFEPAARLRHLNVGRPGSLVRERLLCGLRFGRFRAERWTFPRRLLYAAASPLVPLVLARRHVAALRRRVGEPPRPASTALWVAVALVARAAGEALGYLGAGRDSAAAAAELEIHKVRYAGRRGE
jgi:hypothetical protein